MIRILQIFRNSIGMIYFQESEIIPKKIMDYLFPIFQDCHSFCEEIVRK